jgi:hypothetical protein
MHIFITVGNQSPAWLSFLLLLAGDIETNPGPTWICDICTRTISQKQCSVRCNTCNKWVHLKCTPLTSTRQYTSNFICAHCIPPNPPVNNPPSHSGEPSSKSIPHINILQYNINGINNKTDELAHTLQTNNIHIALIQETKLKHTNKTPSFPDFVAIRSDRPGNKGGGGLLTLMHKTISHTPIDCTHLNLNTQEVQGFKIPLSRGKHFNIYNTYIPPRESHHFSNPPPIDRLLSSPDSLICGDFNAHHELWHSTLSDSRGNNIYDTLQQYNLITLNRNTPTRMTLNGTSTSPDITIAAPHLATSISWRTLSQGASNHLPIVCRLHRVAPKSQATKRSYTNYRKADWESFTRETEKRFSTITSTGDVREDE